MNPDIWACAAIGSSLTAAIFWGLSRRAPHVRQEDLAADTAVDLPVLRGRYDVLTQGSGDGSFFCQSCTADGRRVALKSRCTCDDDCGSEWCNPLYTAPATVTWDDVMTDAVVPDSAADTLAPATWSYTSELSSGTVAQKIQVAPRSTPSGTEGWTIENGKWHRPAALVSHLPENDWLAMLLLEAEQLVWTPDPEPELVTTAPASKTTSTRRPTTRRAPAAKRRTTRGTT